MNYQRKQAIRLFFARNKSGTCISKKAVTRFVYGPLAVLKSTGAHPSTDYKIYPFLDELSNIVKQLTLKMSLIGLPGAVGN